MYATGNDRLALQSSVKMEMMGGLESFRGPINCG